MDKIRINYCGMPALAFEAIPTLRKKVEDYSDGVTHPRILSRLLVYYNWCNRWELGMTSFITLGLVDTIADPMVELINKDLARETVIRRAFRLGQPNIEVVHNQPTATDSGASSRVLLVVLLMLVEAIMMLMLLPVVGPLKKVNIYAALGAKEKRDLQRTMNTTQSVQNLHHSYLFCPRLQEYFKYAIIGLNFFNNFKDRYNELITLASTLGGLGFDSLFSRFQWDEDMIKYVTGKMPYQHGESWTKEKRIPVVINMDIQYFLVVDILSKRKRLRFMTTAYLSSMMMFFTHMQLL
ncbi:hypothetical protein FXO38_17810 [Capsicum annuum]|nr:hypothetical protein FXO38_17810 [Capsicum annuum]KAF3659327.1 hypothetical protein FXO37_14027 [Capsicum annuum]